MHFIGSTIDNQPEPKPQRELFSKLSDASRGLLVLGVVLYLFGFVAMASFLARFGVASFDIINARFISAGIVTIIPVSIAILIAWQFAKAFPLKSYFRPHNRQRRLWFLYLVLPVLSSIAGAGLWSLLTLGTYSAPMPQDMTQFHPLGEWDRIGAHLPSGIAFGLLGSDYVVRYWILVAVYLIAPGVLLYLFGVLCRYLWRVLRDRYRKPINAAARSGLSSVPAPSESQGNSAAEGTLTQDQSVPQSSWLGVRLVVLLEIVLIVRVVIMLWYAYMHLVASSADFHTIGETKIGAAAMGHWMLLSIVGIYVIVNVFGLPDKGLGRGLSEWFKASSDPVQFVNMMLFPGIAAIVLFGSTVFPHISYTVGGGRPRLVILPVSNGLGIAANEGVYLIGESSQHYFLVVLRDSVGSALQVAKDELPVIVTRRGATKVPESVAEHISAGEGPSVVREGARPAKAAR